MFPTSLFLAGLPLLALGARHQGTSRLHRDIAQNLRRSTAYTLEDMFQGDSFFDGFQFDAIPDPTHGQVNYLSQSDAQSAGLAYVQSNGAVIMRVDDTTQLASGQNRNSVRVSSKKTYNSGLILADIYSMPHGCAVWPAYWMVGAGTWPDGGEIDIIEGVNNQAQNQVTLHSGSGCTFNTSPPAATKNTTTGAIEAFTGHVINTMCVSTDTSNAGCAVLDTTPTSFGHAHNNAAGGVRATLINDDGISNWFFPRGQIPESIQSGNPDPTTFGVPTMFVSSDDCTVSDHFSNMNIVFDTTLCGDWAGGAYASSGCPGSCASAVMDPDNFSLAKWSINYVAVYQPSS